eukprot:CFRG3539T1
MSHNVPTAECLRTIPEIFETNVSECLAARTKSLSKVTGLGPPDMCHITKVQEGKKSILSSVQLPPSLVGSYHYCYGIDCSSPAGVAAYFNGLVNDMGNINMTKGAWRIQSGTYCSYNALARVDVRVEVTMPGTVNAYVLDEQGRRFGCDDRVWQETQVCAVLRALSMVSPFAVHIDCLRTFKPLGHPSEERSFLKSAEALFGYGKFLGTDVLTAPPTSVNNRLTVGLKEYFFNSSRYAQGIAFFEKFVEQDPELVSIIAEAMDMLNQTGKAVCLLAKTLLEVPSSSTMLMQQSQLLLSVGDKENALDLAKLVVDLSPAQAQSWINLATMYTANRDYKMALVALNVTPMAHGPEFRLPEMPKPHWMSNSNEVMRDMVEEEEDGDPTLSNLPASSLKGTFAAAYNVLTRILTEITWDELLSFRSKVFLMEEEYTSTFKQQAPLSSSVPDDAEKPVPNEEINMVTGEASNPTHASGIEGDTRDSVDVVHSEHECSVDKHTSSTDEKSDETDTVKQATDEGLGVDGPEEKAGLGEAGLGENNPEEDAGLGVNNPEEDAGLGVNDPDDDNGLGVADAGLESTGEEKDMETTTSLVNEKESIPLQPVSTSVDGGLATPSNPVTFRTRDSISDAFLDTPIAGGKRLLERWLDQLFTALYQDLMCNVLWKAQEQNTNSQQSHTVGDYLRYGVLTKRLHHKDDAIQAFQKCTQTGFCLRGLLQTLDTYSFDGFVEETLSTVDIICRFYDDHKQLMVPHMVEGAVFRLISKHGLSMITQLGRDYVKNNSFIKKIVDSAIRQQVHGFDR